MTNLRWWFRKIFVAFSQNLNFTAVSRNLSNFLIKWQTKGTFWKISTCRSLQSQSFMHLKSQLKFNYCHHLNVWSIINIWWNYFMEEKVIKNQGQNVNLHFQFIIATFLITSFKLWAPIVENEQFEIGVQVT